MSDLSDLAALTRSWAKADAEAIERAHAIDWAAPHDQVRVLASNGNLYVFDFK